MEKNVLDFTLPIWWILPALLVAVGMAYLLYSKKGLPWNKNQNLVLGVLRFTAIFLILLLFLEPLIRKITNEIERPIIVIGVDNSSSVSTIHNSEELQKLVSDIKEMQAQLIDNKDYLVEVFPLEGESDSLSFEEPSTNYSEFFSKVDNQYSNKNLTAVLLATDGIFNRGSSPAFKTFQYPVYTLGLGDTIPQRDVAFTNVRSNRVAYSGNEFPIQVELEGEGFVGRVAEIRITEAGSLVESKKEAIKTSGNELTFFINASNPGLRHYTISVTEFDGEITYENNKHDLFIEILESKKKVLISGLSPHPDMRAIRSALEVTGNYEVILNIHGIQDPPKNQQFDVQILFDGVQPQPGKSGSWLINSNMSGLHMNSIPFVKFTPEGPPDNVTPAYNPDFSKFKLQREPSKLRDYPPIRAPFGSYDLAGPYEVLFYQQVGSVVTKKPLIAVFDDGNKRQVLSVGLGIWQWRLQESARNDEPELFTEIVQKLVQFLSINDSKKQFSVTRVRDVFTQGETVMFDVEIYDDILEPIEGQPYAVEVFDENGHNQLFEFVYSSKSDQARTTPFEPGTYSFKARTQVGSDILSDAGEFLVNALQLEQRNLTANHDLLRRVSEKSRGEYFHLSSFESLKQKLLDSTFQGIIQTDHTRQPLISVFWMLILIVSLLCTEWVLRKVWGSY